MAKTIRKKKKQRSVSRIVFIVFFQLFLVLLIILAIYMVRLDVKVREKIDGNVWVLPPAVYGRMIDLEPGMNYTQKEMIALLEGTQYRKADVITQSGDFVVKGNSIELMRRAFEFPDVTESAVKTRLVFEKDHIAKIENMDSGREFGFFRLDPKLITMLSSPKGEQRLFVRGHQFPQALVDVLLITEDRNFYKHDGVSFSSIARAMLANFKAGRTVQGGSTLTQQLVKNLFLSNERSLSRKIPEALMAIVMDHRYSKERILELYLNEVYLGQSGKGGRGGEQIRGFPLASIYYFGRPVSELGTDQLAMLVAMVKGAGLYNPWRSPELVMKRRNLVLELMKNNNKIDEIEFQSLIVRPLGLQKEGEIITPQPAFVELVLKELEDKLGPQLDLLSGVKIFTTLDPIAQSAVEKAVVEGVPEIRRARKVEDLETAMIVIDRLSGEVRALVGGSKPNFPGFNRALNARRPIGSLSKPPIYLTALFFPERYQLNTLVEDSPLYVPTAGGSVWEPKNIDNRFVGNITLEEAFAKSRNIPAVRVGLDVSVQSVISTMELLGAPKSSLVPVPAMLLGSTSLTPIEVGQMYQAIGSGGHFAPLSSVRSIIGDHGKVIYQSYPRSHLVVSPQATYLTMHAMQMVVENGSARALANTFGKYRLAGKTGTTNDLRDSWFVGMDGKEVVVSWLGRDNYGPANITGSNGALQLFRRYMENQTPVVLTFKQPEGIVKMPIDQSGEFACYDTGKTLPAWITDPDAYCQMARQGRTTDMQNQNNEDYDEQRDSFNRWFRSLF